MWDGVNPLSQTKQSIFLTDAIGKDRPKNFPELRTFLGFKRKKIIDLWIDINCDTEKYPDIGYKVV